MRVFFIGFGQAGGKVVDMFMEQDKTNLFRAIAVNTARTDLLGLKQIPMKDRVLIGQTVVKGHGVGTENALGAKITRDEIDPIVTAIESIGTHDIDAFVIVAGLGGGTGSGGTPVLAQALKNLYQEPVYTIGIIPSPDEGRLYSYNAARSLTTLVNIADNTFIFDNAAWRKEGESIKTAYDRINDEIVRRFGVLFRAGEVGQGGVGEMVVDSSEIINTLRGGGITTVGFAKTEAISPRLKQKQGAAERPLPRPPLEGARRAAAPRRRPLGQDRLARPVGRARSAHAPLQLPLGEPRPDPARRTSRGDGPEGCREGPRLDRGAARRRGDPLGRLPDQVELHRRGRGARLDRRRPAHPRPARDGEGDERGARKTEDGRTDHVR